jgi:hypothetical protein
LSISNFVKLHQRKKTQFKNYKLFEGKPDLNLARGNHHHLLHILNSRAYSFKCDSFNKGDSGKIVGTHFTLDASREQSTTTP